MTRMMKDSGVEWIGEIPCSWELRRLKDFFDFEKGKNAAIYTQEYIAENVGDYPVYSGQTENNGIMGKINQYDYDVDACLFTTTVGAKVMTSKILKGKFSLSQNCLIMKQKKECSINFYYYALMPLFEYTKSLIPSYMQPSLRIEDLKKFAFYAPDLQEQQKIAAFLDDKCGAIDDIITKTEQSIEEYKKLKQSVITKAVTKGIRPNRPMQDSNIEWIGEIPTDWEIKRFRYIADKFLKGSGITKDDVKEDGNIKCVRYGEIYSKYNYTFNDCLSCTNVEEISAPQYFSYGDLLFAGTGELIEEIGKSIVYLGNDKCLAGGDIIVVKHRHNPAFLNYMLNSDVAIYQKSRNKIKLKVVHISAAEIKNIIVPLPPIDEQKEIADYLDEKCAEIDTLIEKKQQFLAEMANYKKSLIYEYVTGKKEVA